MLQKGFYKSIGIEDYHRALPYYAWTKGQVERFFGTVCNKFTKWFSSYTGTLTGSKTFAKVEKDIKGMLERGEELLTMEEFYAEWSKWLKTSYDVKKQGGLVNQGEKYVTPKKLLGQCREILQGSSTKELCNTAHDEVREMLREKCWN